MIYGCIFLVESMLIIIHTSIFELFVQNLKKCNLTLAMSPTCHSNNTTTIC